jgi:hypothetical protein
VPDERVTQEHLDAQAAKVDALRAADQWEQSKVEFDKLHEMRKESIRQAVYHGERPPAAYNEHVIGGDAKRDR